MDDKIAADQTICDSILMRHCLQFREGRATIVVEPHAYGVDDRGMHILLAWPLEIVEDNSEHTSFSLFKLERMHEVRMLDQTIDRPRPGYVEAKRFIKRVHRQI